MNNFAENFQSEDNSMRDQLVVDQSFLSLAAFGGLFLIGVISFLVTYIPFSQLSNPIKISFLFVLSGMTSMSILIFLSSVKILLYKNASLLFDSSGIVDNASIFSFGRILKQDIADVYITEFFGQQIFAIRLSPQFANWDKAISSSTWKYLYSLFLGRKIFLPLDFIDADPLFVKRVVNQIKKVIFENENYEMVKKNSSLGMIKNFPSQYSGELNNIIPKNNKPNEKPEEAKKENDPTLHSKSQDEKLDDKENKIVEDSVSKKSSKITSSQEKINKIKKEIIESKFDRLLCDLFSDEIRHFPSWAENNPERLPSGVRSPIFSNVNEYEEFGELNFRGHHLKIELSRNPEKQRDAFIKVFVDGKEYCGMRVRVEIGELAPVRIKKFLRGSWENLFKELSHACLIARNGGEAIEREVTEYTELTENIEEMKKNFGISDED